MRHGRGIQTFEDGQRYDGDWKEDKWHGQGILQSPDGSRYEGEFQNGSKHGEGTEYGLYKIFSGQWKNGKRL